MQRSLCVIDFYDFLSNNFADPKFAGIGRGEKSFFLK